MLNNANLFKLQNIILNYIFYLLPLFAILGNFLINLALLIVSILFFVEKLGKKKNFNFFTTFEFKLFLILYLYLVVNSFFSQEIIFSLKRTLPYFKFLIFLMFYKELIENKTINLKIAFRFWLIIIIFLSLDIIYQYSFGRDIFGYVTNYPSRNSGFFFDELVAGNFLLSLSFLTIIFFKDKIKNIYIIIFLTLIFCVTIMTGEKSNIIKFSIIYFFTLFWLYEFKIKKIFPKFLFFIFFILPIFYFFNGKDLKDRFMYYLGEKEMSLKEKYFTTPYGAHTLNAYFVFKDNLFFGVGNKNFRYACSNHDEKVLKYQAEIFSKYLEQYHHRDNKKATFGDHSGCLSHPHQVYNELLSEHGLIGTIIIFSIFFMIIKNNLKNRKLSNLNIVAGIYLVVFFIPILPSGSIFTTLNSLFLWINALFFLTRFKIIYE